MNALRAVGAQKLVPPSPFQGPGGFHAEYVTHYGFDLLGFRGAQKTVADLATISQDEVKALAEALYREHPDADTLYIPAPTGASSSSSSRWSRSSGSTWSSRYRPSSGRPCAAPA